MESQKGERVIKPVKMGTEGWILKCPKLISNNEKQRLKVQSRGQALKYTILKTKAKTQKNLEIYMNFSAKIWFLFFCKVIVK